MMDHTVPKTFVLIIMPFSKEFDDVYQLGIKTACANVGAYAERLDEQIYQESIIQRIYNQIAKADIIIADMTGRNPNVYYETGYAHALGKKVILITQEKEDIPFDLQDYPHIIYGGRITSLIPDLERRLGWFINNPENNVTLQRLIEVYINGKPSKEKPVIEGIYKHETRFDFKLDFHNPAGICLKSKRFQFGIEISKVVKKIFFSQNKYSESLRGCGS
ncbi:hypothetical protein QUF72_19335 [Desulfobacterales bacterium HSG2]|nr:hypothetical protein [Desulfobacterales bacterium HSG2]